MKSVAGTSFYIDAGPREEGGLGSWSFEVTEQGWEVHGFNRTFQLDMTSGSQLLPVYFKEKLCDLGRGVPPSLMVHLRRVWNAHRSGSHSKEEIEQALDLVIQSLFEPCGTLGPDSILDAGPRAR